MIYSALFTALIAIGAYIRIPVPVVPFTLQFQFAGLSGLLLGKKYGAAAVAAYLLIGLAGVPIFAGGGGPGYVLMPTFGYLIGFLAGAYAAGAISARRFTYKNLLAAGFVFFTIVYATGMAYFFVITNYYMKSPIGLGYLFLHCFIATAPADAAMTFLSARLAQKLIPHMRLDVYPPYLEIK